MARQDERDAAGAIIRDLLGYIEELEANLDAADENLASEGGCGTKEWKEGAAEYLPRDKRLSYVRDDYVAALDEARAYLGDAA
ncbi:MAG: hypothetical protein EKK38_17515 [Hyphomicrobium sp.]|nr:MAG: hypothetical protein EKK38_17515 [Hyphomicrobium sp.]